MAGQEVVIKINGDIKGFTDALDKIQKQTEDLSGALAETAKVAGVAFAALTAEIGLAVHAYADSEASSRKLTQALQNQGIFSESLIASYRKQAEAIQELTGLDDDAIIKGQAKLQTFLGQKAITEDLTKAMADLSTETGSLESAAEILGRGIEGNVRGLKQFGIVVEDGLSKQERMEKILSQVNVKFGDQATAANKGLGAITGLKTAFGNLQEEIGAKFAPAISVAIKYLTDFLNSARENEGLIQLTAGILAFGSVIAGTIAGLAALGVALTAAGTAFTAISVVTGIALGPLAIAVGIIAALAGGMTFLGAKALFAKDGLEGLDEQVTKTQEKIETLKTLIEKEPIGSVVSENYKKQLEEYENELAILQAKIIEVSANQMAKTDQSTEKKKAADQATEIQKQKEEDELNILQAGEELKALELQRASKQSIDLKKKEIEELKLLADEKYQGDKDALVDHIDQLNALEDAAAKNDLERKNIYREDTLAQSKEFNALTKEEQDIFMEQESADLENMQMTKQDAKIEYVKREQEAHIKANNQYLLDEQKFGASYATINKAMHSEIFQGSKQAFGELAQLQQSSNSTLKEIGKVAAVANIVIKTAESAMNIYAGFSVIPFIGPALGVAGAAAAVAFGAEQIGRVTGAAQGGVLTGGIPGVDSIPLLAQQGELVSPVANFEEVIGSVRAAREAEKVQESGAFSPGQNGTLNVLIGFDGREASQMLTVRQIEDRALGISPEAAA